MTRLDQALAAASDTHFLVIERGARHQAADVFRAAFGASRAVVVADENTFPAAGRDVQDRFGRDAEPPILFGPDIYAEYPLVERLRTALEPLDAVPVAVGSGTINDLTKLAAHQLGRPYMAVATAASMDGYTAYGASITREGSKHTIECPAPRAVVADLDVISNAPDGMNASGYADLMAKCPAGADWIVAECAGVEPVDPLSWSLVQDDLRSWLADPRGIRRRDPGCLRHLMHGLLMGGFAMQAYRSSRPASGAEHQFSHLWDMQHHTHNGAAPSHGFKVGIGTLASLALYEAVLRHERPPLDARGWPTFDAVAERIRAALGELAETAIEETRAKYLDAAALRAQLARLSDRWPELRARLARHLPAFSEVRDMLREAGCPHEPEQIGIDRGRLRLAYEQARYIRRRFTMLDLAVRTGLMDSALEAIFGESGPWPIPISVARPMRKSSAPVRPDLARVRHVVLDMDGTIYKGKRLFECTLPFLARLRDLDIGYTFLTNNTSRSKADYTARLRQFGIEAREQQIFTPADSAIVYLAAYRRLAVLGTPSLCEQFRQAGFTVTWDDPQAVVVGFDTTLTFERLCRAAWWIQSGLPFIATHPDLVCPTGEPTVLVDCGSICACLTAATGRRPVVLGKPDPGILLDLCARLGLAPDQVAMVGDRIYTDMAMARNAGVVSVLVLTGEATAEDAAALVQPPDLVVADIGELGVCLKESQS